ncbi:MAG: putative DNA-binding domain-containing protein [Oligoflexus sp.]
MKMESLQYHVQSVIVADQDASLNPDWIKAEISPSDTMDGAERLQIYRDMFEARVIDALIDDYPLLHSLLGCSRFEDLALAYIQEYPSRSFTLENLGDHFPVFMDSQNLTDRPFGADLARLEFAITQAFHAKDTALLQTDRLQMAEIDQWLDCVLKPVPSLKLLRCQYDVNALYSAYQEDALPEEPALPTAETLIMVWKFQDHIWRLELDAISFSFLQSLSAGASLGEAIDQILAQEMSPEKVQDVFTSFATWVAEGVFQEP